ncbi:phenylacetaldoxime dehydratase family protein [Pseudomonas sp. SDO55104_S430]
MESAIPAHLRATRTQPAAMSEGHTPPFPAWATRFDPLIGQVVMAYFGVQSAATPGIEALEPITSLFSLPDGPGYWDPAHCQDAAGFHNLIAIAYWSDPVTFERWRQESGFDAWWNDPQRLTEQVGWFIEIVSPTADRFETLQASLGAPEGVSHLAKSLSDNPVQEHGYWGSVRDRFAIAQTDPLQGEKPEASTFSGQSRVRLPGRQNLCLIRSGQDWAATRDKERHLYLQDIQPVLEEGMTYLRDQGRALGCLSCRFMRVLDTTTGEPLEKSFGLAHFDDLAHLEEWAKTHPTHLAIFGGFMRYVRALDFQVALRLYHEVSVIPADAQCFEYINCHPGSGLLRS